MALRTTLSGSSPPPASGPDVLNEYAARIGTLFDASCLPLTAVGGTADAVTATLDPPLATAGVFVDGMKFTITWGATNTAGVTLAINGGAALPVLDAAGNVLIPGAIEAGLRSQIEYVGGSFRILSSQGGAGGSESYYWALTANGTWTKPAGLDDDRMVTIEAWGGGGGGGTASGGGGGGGGGYAMRRIRAADLPSSVSVTIGAGGTANSSGGNTNFGAILTAFGGGGGTGSGAAGGGGGGEVTKGGSASGSVVGSAGMIGGGAGGAPSSGSGEFARSIWGGGGGGGGGGSTGTGGAGGAAVFGGGGGGGAAGSAGAGGASVYGGNGGASGVAGSAPGGGGGRNAAGARGEVRVWI